MTAPRLYAYSFGLCLASPALLFAAINHYALQSAGGDAFVLLILMLLACGFIGWIVSRLPQRWRALAALAAINGTLACLYGPLNELLGAVPSSIFFHEYNWVYLSLVLLVNGVAFLSRHRPARLLLLVLALLIPVLTGLWSRFGHDGLEAGHEGVGAKPNIYYFVLDGHAGTKREIGLSAANKAEFATFLQETGFSAMEGGRSNYVQTRQAMEAITGLDYVEAGRIAASEFNFHYPQSARKDVPPRLNAQLAAAGYALHDIYDAGYGCQVRWSNCHYPARYFTLSGMAREMAGYSLLKLWKSFSRALTSVDAVAMTVDLQPELLAARQPFFLMIHHISPHPPYLYDPQCRRRVTLNIARPASDWAPSRRKDYAHETACLNRDVAHAVRTLITRDPSAIIVLQSDHGPWFDMYLHRSRPLAEWPPEALTERLSYLNQVRLPDACRPYVRSTMAQVNAARLVVACARGETPRFLPERSFITSYSAADFRELPPLAIAR